MNEYVVEDNFYFEKRGGWCAVVSTTVDDAENFPIKSGDTLEGGIKVLEVSLFSLSFMWQKTNRRSVGLMLDKEVKRGETIKLEAKE